jgi:hypothetical protein
MKLLIMSFLLHHPVTSFCCYSVARCFQITSVYVLRSVYVNINIVQQLLEEPIWILFTVFQLFISPF